MDFNGMSSEKLVNTILKDRRYCPCMLIGRHVSTFKKIYRDRIFTVYKLDEVRDVVENFHGVDDVDGRYIVLDGIGYLSDVGQNSLLKFLEETKLPVIVLTFKDNVSPIIMSRMKFVFKEPISEVKNLNFMTVKSALSSLDSKKKGDSEFNESDEVNFFAENCPAAFVLKYSAGGYNNSTNERLLKIITSIDS